MRGINNKKIILASTSPQRKGLLQQIGIKFTVMPSSYREEMHLKLLPHKLVMHLALRKAQNVAKKVKGGLVLGADTILVVGKKRIGKPKNRADAIKKLKLIAGKTITAYSGIAIINSQTGKTVTDYELTKIIVRKAGDNEIKSYVNTGEPLSKAGAIAIQGFGAVFIKRIDGCYSNVVGLPLHCLFRNLKKFGVDIFEYKK